MADPVESMQKISLTESQVVEPVMKKARKPIAVLTILLALTVVLAGIGSGYALAQLRRGGASAVNGAVTEAPADSSLVKAGEIYGDKEGSHFKDETEGVLVRGGIEGEGSHHLVRPGGISQNVYLTSSILDLDLFAGDKVAIKGETFSAQKAGWLMDVGQVKVLELNVSSPDETE